ncbi:MAG: fasciclin domain-containing protein [Acidobacteriota bacterium]|nr:MAG: fasciclin domain-containing protein [Acidobacteriota bacterium]
MKSLRCSLWVASLSVVGLVLGVTLAAAGSGYAPSKAYSSDVQDLVDFAASAEDFSTLVTAVKSAGLVETLKGDGPFTIFAPTNEAFAQLPAGTLDQLLADKDALTRVLTYHVVPGRVLAKDVINVTEAPTVLGKTLPVDSSSGVKVGGANVIKTDLIASNGVIHVIDAVLLP